MPKRLQWLVMFMVSVSSAFAAPSAQPAPSDADQRKAAAVLSAWQRAQNQGLMRNYEQLFAPEFQGVRRSGKRVVPLDRKGWLADRARMFGKEMYVDVAQVNMTAAAEGRITVAFMQRFMQGEYIDEGPKQLEIDVASGRIVREELLTSKVLWKPGMCRKALRQRRARSAGVLLLGPAEAVCLTRSRDDATTMVAHYGLVRRGALVGELHEETLAQEPEKDDDSSRTDEITLAPRRLSSTRVVAELVTIKTETFPMGNDSVRTTAWYVATSTGLNQVLTYEEKSGTGEEDQSTTCEAEALDAERDGYPKVRLVCKTTKSNYHDENPDKRYELDSDEDITSYEWRNGAYVAQ